MVPRISVNTSASDLRSAKRQSHLRSLDAVCGFHIWGLARVAITMIVILVSGSAGSADSSLDQVQEFDSFRPAYERATTWLDSFRSSDSSRRIHSVSDEGQTTNEESEFDLSDFSGWPDERDRDAGFARLASGRYQIDDDEVDELSDPAEPLLDVDSTLNDQVASPSVKGRMISTEDVFSEGPTACNPGLCWQVLPRGLLYRTYMAGEKEPRMQFLHLKDIKNKRTVWDAVLGGRLGLLRYGTAGVDDPQGFQLDLEGAVFARVLPNEPSAMLEGSDYRVGMYGTWREDQISYRAGYYHISSHVGDEYLLANPAFQRLNYVRDSLLAGTSCDFTDASRVYGEVGYALGVQGGAKPLEFQVGTEYTPVNRSSAMGAPFAGINGHFREDFDFQGGMNIVSGWCWQGIETRHRIRVGLNYYHGPSLQYEFFDRWENLVGGGVWVDY